MKQFYAMFCLFVVITLCGCGGVGGVADLVDGKQKRSTELILQNTSEAPVNMWVDDERLKSDNLVDPGENRKRYYEIEYDGSGGWGGFTVYIGMNGQTIKKKRHSTFSLVHPSHIMATYDKSGEITFKEAR